MIYLTACNKPHPTKPSVVCVKPDSHLDKYHRGEVKVDRGTYIHTDVYLWADESVWPNTTQHYKEGLPQMSVRTPEAWERPTRG